MLMFALAITSLLFGVLVSLVMIVMFLAGGANSNAAKIRQIKWFLASVVAVELLSMSCSIGLLVAGQTGYACGVGLVPVLYAIALVAMLMKLEW